MNALFADQNIRLIKNREKNYTRSVGIKGEVRVESAATKSEKTGLPIENKNLTNEVLKKSHTL